MVATDVHDPSQEPLYSNAAGGVWLAPSLVAVAPAEEAWVHIQELHHAAIGDEVHRYVTDAGGSGPDEAFTAYSNAIVGVLGQIGGTSPRAADALLGSLTEHVDLMGSFQGLEGVGLSAYRAASMLGVRTGNMEAFESVLQHLGVPEIGGGGMPTTPLLDKATSQLGLPATEHLREAVGGALAGGHAGPVVGGSFGRVLGELAASGAVALGDAVGVDLQRVGGLVSSTVAGAAEGAAVGSLIVPGVGTTVGGIIGGVIGFFSDLLGGTQQQQKHHQAGHDVAEGKAVVVAPPASVHSRSQGASIHIQRDGTPALAPAGAHPERGGSTSSGKCLVPRQDRCPYDEDRIDPDFTVTYWSEAFLLVSAAPIGPGVDGLVTSTADGSLMMAPLPEVDVSAVMVTGGEVFEAQMKDLAAALQVRFTEAPAFETIPEEWAAVVVRSSRPVDAGPSLVTELARYLAAEGFTPYTPTVTVLRELHRRYGRTPGGW